MMLLLTINTLDGKGESDSRCLLNLEEMVRLTLTIINDDHTDDTFGERERKRDTRRQLQQVSSSDCVI